MCNLKIYFTEMVIFSLRVYWFLLNSKQVIFVLVVLPATQESLKQLCACIYVHVYVHQGVFSAKPLQIWLIYKIDFCFFLNYTSFTAKCIVCAYCQQYDNKIHSLHEDLLAWWRNFSMYIKYCHRSNKMLQGTLIISPSLEESFSKDEFT